jgi:anthranilate synthase component 1
MEILAEMEQQPRGAYTGSIGYINRNGDMDLNILIRTLVRMGDSVSFRAGGGIVADSVPLHELAETRAKAKGLLQVFALERPA